LEGPNKIAKILGQYILSPRRSLNPYKILWNVDSLLGNYRKITSCTTAVARERLRKHTKAAISRQQEYTTIRVSCVSLPRCHKQDKLGTRFSE
jgi:hypothetical protein